jgi:drug/metabolite transporter (DMT)-like permease
LENGHRVGDVVVVEMLGVGLWALLGLAGAWWLVTGRKLIYDLPRGIKEGRFLRVMGLAYVLLAAFLIYMALHGSFSAEAVVLGYLLFAVGLALALNRRRKERIRRGAG